MESFQKFNLNSNPTPAELKSTLDLFSFPSSPFFIFGLLPHPLPLLNGPHDPSFFPVKLWEMVGRVLGGWVLFLQVNAIYDLLVQATGTDHSNR